MKTISILLATILLLTGVLEAAPPSGSQPLTSSIITSQGRTVYAMLSYAAGSESMPATKARLEQDLHAIERVFQDFVVARAPGGRRAVLLIRATQHVGPAITTLSRTPAVAKASIHPAGGGLVGTTRLGEGYVIETTTARLAFNDLLALVLLLPRLTDQAPVVVADGDEVLRQVKESQEFHEFSRLEVSFGPQGMWSTEGKQLAPVWRAGELTYRVIDLAGATLIELKPLPYYIARPSWSPPVPRFVAGATATELLIAEAHSGAVHRLDLTALFPERYLRITEVLEMAASPDGEQIAFTLSFNMPETFWQRENHSYVYHLVAREVKVAPPLEPINPRVQEPAPGRGIVLDFITPQPGHVSPVWQRINQGWNRGSLSRQQSHIGALWAQLLPQDKPFVFLPIQFFLQHRFIAYASQTEIVVYDRVQRKYHRMDAKTLHSDYRKVEGVRFAYDPNNPRSQVYIWLMWLGRTAEGHRWDIAADTTVPLATTLEQLKRYGQRRDWEFVPATVNFALPSDTTILIGDQATAAIWRRLLSSLSHAFWALSVWLGVMFFVFLLPFVVACFFTLLGARKLRRSGMFQGAVPFIAALAFLGLSMLALRLAMPYSEIIRVRVYPLLWFPHGSAAGMLFMSGFVLGVAALLTMLVFSQSRRLQSAVIPNAASFTQARGSQAALAGVTYGLAGAAIALLLFLWAAATLPYHLPAHLSERVFVVIFYGLCLAVVFFLLRAPLVLVSYSTAAAVFLGVAGLVSYPLSMSEFIGALSVEGWIRHIGLVSPLAAFCLVYLLRAELSRRGYVLTTRAALFGSALLAVPAIYVVIHGERLHWYLLPLRSLALPATMLLGAVTVISFISALASLLHILRKEALKVKEPTTEFTDPITPVGLAAKPHAQRPRGLLGPLMTAAAALMVFVLIVVEAQTGVMRSPGGYVGLLLLLFFLIVSAVFQLGSSIAARLGQLFKAEEAKGTEPFASP
ncbi:MAG: hypothetical protein KGZ66_03720 [Selenomonadales bacterium]|nr:hypothetical protein [Selenomonadales bacterium]